MTDDGQFSEIDVSDLIDDTENVVDALEGNFSEAINSDANIQNTESTNSEGQLEKKTQNANKHEFLRTKLPNSRIKNIMKMDPDVHVINADAAFLVTKATEMFLETIAKETYAYTAQHKRKTIAKKDLDVVINKIDCLCFLEGAMDF